jgi:HSP20 family protein
MRLTPWRKQTDLSRERGGLRRLRDEMDNLFDSFFGSTRLSEWGGPESAGGWMPDLEVIESEKEFVVRAEVPGLDPKDIEVSLTGNRLTLSGEKKEETEEKKGGYYHSERRFGSFRRSIELPTGANADTVTAEYDKGVLTLKIGKTAGATSQRIPIKTATTPVQPPTPKRTK